MLFHMLLDRYAQPTRMVSGCQSSVKMGLLLSEVRKEGYLIVKNDSNCNDYQILSMVSGYFRLWRISVRLHVL